MTTGYTWLGSFTEWDPVTGNANWTLTNGLSGAASSRTVAVANGRAYFIGSSLYCVNLATHTNAWSVSGGFGGTPAIANGIVYAISNKVVSAFYDQRRHLCCPAIRPQSRRL